MRTMVVRGSEDAGIVGDQDFSALPVCIAGSRMVSSGQCTSKYFFYDAVYHRTSNWTGAWVLPP